MSRARVIVRRLGVQRMPGIARDAGFEIDGLADGINVVIGPNGSGKTTTVHAIERILWGAAEGEFLPSLSCTLTIDGVSWEAELNGRQLSWRREGREAAAPDVGTAELRHRYRLALAEMVKAGEADAEFSNEVARAMVGGLDLGLVSSAGGYESRPRGVQTRRKEVEEARRLLDRAMQEEQLLEQRRTRELPELARSLARAREAERLERECNRAIERQTALESLERLATQRDALPLEQLRACQANDRQTLDELESRRDELRKQRDGLQRAIDEATQALGSAQLPDEGIAPQTLDRLESLAAAITNDERDRNDLRRQLPAVEADRDRCLTRLQSAIGTEQIERLDGTVGDAEVEELARASHRLAGEWEATTARRTRLPDRETLGEADTLRKRMDGYQLMGRWMAIAGEAPAVHPLHRAALILLALSGAGLSISLALLHHRLWALGVIPLVIFFTVAWIRRNSETKQRALLRAAHEAEFEKLELGNAVVWNPDEVAARMEELAAGIVRAESAQGRREEHRDLDRLEQQLERKGEQYKKERAALEAKLGVRLPGDDAWLPIFTSNLRQWQAGQDRLRGIEEQISALDRRIDEQLDEAAGTIDPFGEPRAADGGTLGQACARLRQLSDTARSRAAGGSERTERVEPELARVEARWTEFFRARGLADGDRVGLDRLLSQLEGLGGLEDEIKQTSGGVELAAAALGQSSSLLQMDLAELNARRDEAHREAERRDELVQQVDRIEQELERARVGSSVSDGWAAHHGALDQLRELCVDEGRAAVGRMLLERIDAAARQSVVPAVFERSRAIFARITAGRFELQPPDSRDGGFRALDSVDAVEKRVEQLSTGERVQLLLAVRLGFLEHQERYAMPLLLDETFGTSDDERVRAIMDALIEIAREGRQILYFTAQHDEVGKWVRRLDDAGLARNIVDLGTIRAGGRSQATPLAIEPIRAPVVPSPEGRDHASYGRLLGVPGIDPRRMKVSQLHLWHVVDDVEQLHRLLSTQIVTIGQFILYERYAARLPDGIHERTAERVQAGEQLLEDLFEAWQRGRPKLIELPLVLSAGVVSATFEAPVTELLEEVGHDPVRFLEELESGKLGRWRQGNTETIRETFERAGVLPQGERLGRADLEVRLLAQLGREEEALPLDRAWVRRVVGCLPDLDF